MDITLPEREPSDIYRVILEHVSDGVFVLDDCMVIQYFNAAAGLLLNRKPEEVTGRNLLEVFPEAIDSVFQLTYKQAIHDKQFVSFETFFGSEPYLNWYEVRVYPINKGIMVFFQIITERKEREVKIKASEEKYRQLAEHSPAYVCTFMPDGTLLYVNSALADSVGKDATEMIGRCFLDFIPSVEERKTISERYLSLTPESPMETHEQRTCLPGHGTRWEKWTNLGFFDENGNLTQIQAIGFDITEQKESEDVLAARLRLSEYARSHMLEELLQKTLDEAEKLTNSEIGFFHFLSEDQNTIHLQTWSSNTIQNKCRAVGKGFHYPISEAGVWTDCFYQRKPVIHNNYQVLSHRKGTPAGHAEVNRELVVPVIRENLVYAFLGVGNKPWNYDSKDVDTVQQLADMAWDIVLAKQAEENLRESEKQYRTLVENIPGIVYQSEVSAPWRMNYMSDVVHQITGIYPNQFYDRQYVYGEIIHPDDFQYVEEEIQRGVRNHEPFDIVYRIIHRDGRVRWVHEIGRCRYDQDGSPLLLDGVILDITEQKQAEIDLRRSKEYQQAVLDSVNDAIFVDDAATGKIIDVNETTCRMYGYTREEILATKIGNLSSGISPHSHKEALEWLNKARSGTPQVFEWLAKNRSGNLFWVEINIRYTEICGEERFIVTVRDITDRKHEEEARLEMERRLLHAQKLESLGILAGGIAHDFNNLLMAIMGNLGLALEDLSPVSPAVDSVEQAMVAAKRAADLTRQMLAYSGKGRFIIQEINLNELVMENVHMLRSAVSKSVQLNLDLSDSIGLIEADAGQIQQVIMNLITNASEALGEKQGLIVLRTGMRTFSSSDLHQSRLEDVPSEGNFVFLEVQDNGCGMDEATQEKLFDPFFTTKFTGRGLGMSAVLGILRGHHGAIFVESKPGEGTTIRVLFPQANSQFKGEREMVSLPERPSADINKKYHGLVLVVDDEAPVRDYCFKALSRLGFTVLLASDGEAAIKYFHEHSKDILFVILDLTMPKMDGVATFKELKKIRSDLCVILSSGYDEMAATEKFKDQDLAGFIQKPFQVKTLLSQIEKIIQA